MAAGRAVAYSWSRLGLSVLCVMGLGYAAYLFLPPVPQGASLFEPVVVKRAILSDAELQIALAREGFSPGSIDGQPGQQTGQALEAFQSAHGLPVTGLFDASTAQVLKIADPVYALLELSERDFGQIDPPPSSWRERGVRSRMAYHSLLEMVAERHLSDPDWIATLNPAIDWAQLEPEQQIRVPLLVPFCVEAEVSHVQISLSARSLQLVGADGGLRFHCPVSIARSVEKRPSGALRVEVRVSEPNYTFNPNILSGTAAREGIREKFIIQPGPNNPVGLVWIGLNLPSYGIHGTPSPEQVGRTESSGCFRLANWNAQTVLDAVEVGMPVYVSP